jgi:hypothetical protein
MQRLPEQIWSKPHTVRHPPQWRGSVVKSVQTPEQDTSALTQPLPPEHVSPQPPQFVPLVCRSTHPPPHIVRFPAQATMHTPVEQTSLLRQALPQAPQFVASLTVLVHWVAHRTSAPGQTQAPPAQVSPSAHETPQPPQSETLVLVSTHAAPHEVRGLPHCMTHPDWSKT